MLTSRDAGLPTPPAWPARRQRLRYSAGWPQLTAQSRPRTRPDALYSSLRLAPAGRAGRRPGWYHHRYRRHSLVCAAARRVGAAQCVRVAACGRCSTSPARHARTYCRRDRIPRTTRRWGLVALPIGWLALVGLGYTGIYWALGVAGLCQELRAERQPPRC
ncbi:MAG: hypothetical protein WKG07_14830 [Hymenobacter sp.]